jgi:hypothetical protein
MSPITATGASTRSGAKWSPGWDGRAKLVVRLNIPASRVIAAERVERSKIAGSLAFGNDTDSRAATQMAGLPTNAAL